MHHEINIYNINDLSNDRGKTIIMLIKMAKIYENDKYLKVIFHAVKV